MNNLLIKKRPTTLKSVCSIILVVAIVMCFSAPVFAADSRLNAPNVRFSFYTGGSGNAYVDGSANGKYYSMEAGHATLSLYDTEQCYSGGAYRANVYIKSGSGLGTWMGAVNATNTGSGRMHEARFATTKSTQYYLYVTGTGANRTYAAYGEFVNS